MSVSMEARPSKCTVNHDDLEAAYSLLHRLGTIMGTVRQEREILGLTQNALQASADRYTQAVPPMEVPEDISSKLAACKQAFLGRQLIEDHVVDAAIDFYDKFPGYPDLHRMAEIELDMDLPTHEELLPYKEAIHVA